MARVGPQHMTLAILSAQRTGRIYPQEISRTLSFLLEAESTPGPYCSWKDYVNEKKSQ